MIHWHRGARIEHLAVLALESAPVSQTCSRLTGRVHAIMSIFHARWLTANQRSNLRRFAWLVLVETKPIREMTYVSAAAPQGLPATLAAGYVPPDCVAQMRPAATIDQFTCSRGRHLDLQSCRCSRRETAAPTRETRIDRSMLNDEPAGAAPRCSRSCTSPAKPSFDIRHGLPLRSACLSSSRHSATSPVDQT